MSLSKTHSRLVNVLESKGPEPKLKTYKQTPPPPKKTPPTHTHQPTMLTIPKKLLAKLKSKGTLELLSTWTNELLSENGRTVYRGKEGSFALQALTHVRQKWTTVHGAENALPLVAARWLCENTLHEICNHQAKIFSCGLCSLVKGFAFWTLLHHMASQHRETGFWKRLLGAIDGSEVNTWPHAPWPETLPIRARPIERDVEHEAFGNYMKDSHERMERFRAMRDSECLALWFRLNIDWYTMYHDNTPPDWETFTGAVDAFIASTDGSIFRTVQCAVCGVLKSRNGSKWGWVDLGKHFKDVHSKTEAWGRKMIDLPVGRGFDTFGEEIMDEEVRREWIELWKEVDERMAAEAIATKSTNTRYHAKKLPSFAARPTKRPAAMTAKRKLKGKTFNHTRNSEQPNDRVKAGTEEITTK